jgi:hypothetical protein
LPRLVSSLWAQMILSPHFPRRWTMEWTKPVGSGDPLASLPKEMDDGVNHHTHPSKMMGVRTFCIVFVTDL